MDGNHLMRFQSETSVQIPRVFCGLGLSNIKPIVIDLVSRDIKFEASSRGVVLQMGLKIVKDAEK